ncbi:MAG: tetratricopeptide repeat protein [Gemmatimonadales bacterium]|nr:tetratricopeptide repeat protein [Gemmatimonadales bacterium]
MAIKGSLKEASLPDVVQLLFFGRRTGCLALSDRQQFGSIYFEDGWITYATIVNRRDRIGDILLNTGAITREQLDQALALQHGARGRRLGEILVSLGAIAPEELKRVLRFQIDEAVYALFSWSTGTFTFDAGLRPEMEGELERINPENLLLEGARRIDEWSLIEKKVPSFDLIFALDRSLLANETLSFTEAQRRLLPLIDGVRDTREVIDASGLSDFEAGQALFGLITAGLAQRVGMSSKTTPSRLLEAQIEEHRNLGVAFLRSGMLEEAARELRRVIELRPSEGAAPFLLGVIAGKQGRWADAVDSFRQSLDRAGPRGQVMHNLAIALEEVGRLDQADAMFAEAAGRLPENRMVFVNWALLGLRRDDPAVAWARLERVRELDAATPPPLWYFAAVLALAMQEQLEPALALAREAVGAHPAHPVLRNNLAVLLEATGDVAAAETLLRETATDDPALPQLHKNLGDLLYRSGRYDEATQHYDRAAVLAPSLGDDLFFKLGNLAFRRRATVQAREYWAQAVRLNPGHQLARANLELLPVSG